MTMQRRYDPRLANRRAPSLQLLMEDEYPGRKRPKHKNVSLDCGWGRLLFGQTFSDAQVLADSVMAERHNHRDIAFYLKDPHVVLSLAPQELFLDPSHTYRLWLTTYLTGRLSPQGFQVRQLCKYSDTEAINRILKRCGMLPAKQEFIWRHRHSKKLTYAVAEDPRTGEILGTVMGIDHVNAFDDPENGSSLWCLAVDPQAAFPGIGRALVAYLADHYSARGRSYLDLSVMHDNHEAIGLYEDMGFVRVPIFCIKRKNPINEKLFTGPAIPEKLNPYAQIIVDEALRRGIKVNLIDAEEGYFDLHLGGRRITCRESLTELTSAVAMSRCANKKITLRLLKETDLNVPAQKAAGSAESNNAFLHKYGKIVVKPGDSEQGLGITVNIRNEDELKKAVEYAAGYDQEVLLEEMAEGQDLRIIVIDYQTVAAAVRKPAEVAGNGHDDIATLIRKQSRRRQAATHGESSIPVDEVTRQCIEKRGYALEDVLPEGRILRVRETANLHTGGTIHDVTDDLHPHLRTVAEKAARVLNIPVVGLDLMVPEVKGEEYKIIEANERPGLANHEPQPTAQRFIDLLFPQSRIKHEEHVKKASGH